MNIRNELDSLKTTDVYSLLLFALYKIKDIPEYSTLSELVYVLDQKSFLKICEYFGGLTITIPTIEEVELMINALLLYNRVDIDKIDMKLAKKSLDLPVVKSNKVELLYNNLKDILKTYSFSPRG